MRRVASSRTHRRTRLLAVALLACGANAGAQTLQEFSPVRNDSADRLTIFPDGGARNVVGQQTSTATTGTSGITYRGSAYVVSRFVAVLSRPDTLTRRLASTLLPPSAGRAFESALIDVRCACVPWLGRGCATGDGRRVCHGIHGDVSASAATWATRLDTADVVRGTVEVPEWGTGFGPYFDFFDGRVGGSSRVAMVFDAGIATRHLRGGLSSSRPEARALRDTPLQTTARNFTGPDTTLAVRYNEITGALSYDGFGGEIPSFSRGQVVAGIATCAGLNAGPFTSF